MWPLFLKFFLRLCITPLLLISDTIDYRRETLRPASISSHLSPSLPSTFSTFSTFATLCLRICKMFWLTPHTPRNNVRFRHSRVRSPSRGFFSTFLRQPIAATSLLFAQPVTIQMGKIYQSVLCLSKPKNLKDLSARYEFEPLVNVKLLIYAEIKHDRIYMLDTEGVGRSGAV